jgi:hypothetical protein
MLTLDLTTQDFTTLSYQNHKTSTQAVHLAQSKIYISLQRDFSFTIITLILYEIQVYFFIESNYFFKTSPDAHLE